jgi:hypothetical protein
MKQQHKKKTNLKNAFECCARGRRSIEPMIAERQAESHVGRRTLALWRDHQQNQQQTTVNNIEKTYRIQL